MAFIKSTDKFHEWNYEVKEFSIQLPKKKKEIKLEPVQIQAINIMHDYENDLYPVFGIEFIANNATYYTLTKYKNEAHIRLHIQGYYQEKGKTTESLRRDIIKEDFSLLMDESDYDKYESLKKEENKYDYTKISTKNQNVLDEAENNITIYLIKKTYINRGNKQVNAILRKATVLDALCYIFSKAGYNRVLMTKPDNTQVYSTIYIPPMQAKKAISWIDTYYGLYQYGSLRYDDFIGNTCYLIPFNGLCTAWKKDERKVTNILVPTLSNEMAPEACTLRRGTDENFIVIDPNSISIEDESNSYNAITGNLNTNVVDAYSGNILNTKANTASTKEDSAITDGSTTIEKRSENKYFGYTVANLNAATNTVLRVILEDYNFNAIKPNKQVKVVFQDTNLSEKYHYACFITVSANHIFTKDGSKYKLKTYLTLKDVDPSDNASSTYEEENPDGIDFEDDSIDTNIQFSGDIEYDEVIDDTAIDTSDDTSDETTTVDYTDMNWDEAELNNVAQPPDYGDQASIYNEDPDSDYGNTITDNMPDSNVDTLDDPDTYEETDDESDSSSSDNTSSSTNDDDDSLEEYYEDYVPEYSYDVTELEDETKEYDSLGEDLDFTIDNKDNNTNTSTSDSTSSSNTTSK